MSTLPYDSIILDTCSILKKGFVTCMSRLIANQRPEQKILIPQMVLKELEYHAHATNSRCKSRALQMEKDIIALARMGIIYLVGDPDVCEHTDHFIIRYVCSHCFKQKVLVITEDGALNRDLLIINQVTGRLGAPIFVHSINEDGSLFQKYENSWTNSSVPNCFEN